MTPSLNQGRFIREAIRSVLDQDYPRIEYLVIDGGSTDDTLDILRSCDARVSWISEPDAGQSDAIAKGFARARGDILTWLNADDVLAAGAVERAVREFERFPELGLIYGHGMILDADGEETGPFVEIEPFNLWRLLHTLDYVLQPAAFFRRSAYEVAGGLDRTLNWAMDWDLWLRLAAVAEVRFVDQVLAGSREWQDTKTATGGWKRIRELRRVVRRHTGRSWSPGLKLYALDTLRLQLRSALPFLARAVDSAVAFTSRRIIRGTPVHADGWLGPRAALVIPRRWGGFEVELEALSLPPSGSFEVCISTGGQELGRWTVETVGSRRQSIRLPDEVGPDGVGPFAEIQLSSNYHFSSAADPRKLSLRCVDLGPISV